MNTYNKIFTFGWTNPWNLAIFLVAYTQHTLNCLCTCLLMFYVCAQKQGSCFLASSFIEDTVTPFCQPKEVRRSEGRTRQESRHNAAFKQDLFLTTWTDTKWSLSYWSTLHSDCRLTRLTEYVIRELRTGIRCSHSPVWQLRASLWDTRTATGQNRWRLRGKKKKTFNLKFPTTTLSEEKTELWGKAWRIRWDALLVKNRGIRARWMKHKR